MRDATKRRVEKLELARTPPEFPKFQVLFVDSRHDPDGSVWSRASSRWNPWTGASESLDQPWELVRHGNP